MRQRIKIGLVFVFVILSTLLWGQSIETSFIGGRIKKHHDRLLYETPNLSSGIQVSYLKAYDLKDCGWCRYWREPIVDISMVGLSLGDPEVLGYAVGALPAIHFRSWKRKNSEFRWSVGGGLAYLNKSYDQVLNPTNNAIGSNWNNISRLGMSYQYGAWSLGGYLYHFSNGSTATPNSGINVLMVKLGRQLHFKNKMSLETTAHLAPATTLPKQGIDFHLLRGYNQDVVPGGPTYHIHAVSLGYYRRLSDYLRMYGSYEYEFNGRRYKFLINDFSTEQEARKLATSHIISVGTELLFGKIGFRPKLGFYIPHGFTPLDGPFYIKLESHYYPWGAHRRFAPYLGVALKTHFAVAQYISIQTGMAF